MPALDVAQYTDQLSAYFANLPRVDLAYLFGSQARRKAGPLSDVDIAVLLEGMPDTDTCFDLRLEIIGGMMCILRTDDVDVVILNQAPLALQYQVVRDGELIFCRDRRLAVEYRCRVLNLYFDFEPLLERHKQTFFEKVRKGELLSGYNPYRGAFGTNSQVGVHSGRAPTADV